MCLQENVLVQIVWLLIPCIDFNYGMFVPSDY